MAKRQERKKGGNKKHGRASRKPSHYRYNAEGRYITNKLKRITQSEGEVAAEKWRREYGLAKRRTGVLRGLSQRR